MKQILIILILLCSMSVVGQRTDDMHSSYGRLIEYKGSLKKAKIYIDEVKNWIVIDEVKYYILSYTHTKDDYNDYYTYHTVIDGSLKYDIVWDKKHKNLLIKKVTTKKD